MKIQGINNNINCQPLRKVEFARRENTPIIIDQPTVPQDTFSKNELTEQKYNFACLLAAYYKTQYENLVKNGCCKA